MIHGSVGLANAGCVIKKVNRTTNFLERMRGLLGTKQLVFGEGLLITPCSSSVFNRRERILGDILGKPLRN